MKTSHSKQLVVAANVEAEKCVLGAIMADGVILRAVLDAGLKPTDFLISAHRRIFETAEKLFDRGTPVDAVSLAEELGDMPELFAAMTDMMYGVVLEKNHILNHAAIVRKRALLRRLQKFGEWLVTTAATATDAKSLLVHARQRLESYSETETA